MRIIGTTVAEAPAPMLAVAAAAVVGPHTLHLTFANGAHRTLDFSTCLRRSTHSVIQTCLDEARFRQSEIVNGNVNRNDYDLIFPVADLYAGSISRCTDSLQLPTPKSKRPPPLFKPLWQQFAAALPA